MSRSSHSKITPRREFFRGIWAGRLSAQVVIGGIFLFSYEYLVTLVAWGCRGFPIFKGLNLWLTFGGSCCGFHSWKRCSSFFIVSGQKCSTPQRAAACSLFLRKNWLGWTLRATIPNVGVHWANEGLSANSAVIPSLWRGLLCQESRNSWRSQELAGEHRKQWEKRLETKLWGLRAL